MRYTKGFMAVTSVLVLSSVILVVTISLASGAIFGQVTGLSLSNRAHGLAVSCVEYALIELHRTLDYSGNETIMVDTESCSLGYVQGSGNSNRIIESTGNVSGYVERIKVTVGTVSPAIDMVEWEQVVNF